jgi:hypothetical protein
MPNFELLMEYETGNLEVEDILVLFQEIYDTKAYLWLQGHYGRTLQHMIDENLIDL